MAQHEYSDSSLLLTAGLPLTNTVHPRMLQALTNVAELHVKYKFTLASIILSPYMSYGRTALSYMAVSYLMQINLGL